MVKDIQLVADDLKIYYKGFVTALDRGDIDDAIRYLRDMRRELNDNLDYLVSKREALAIQDVMKKNLQESIEDYKKRVKELEEELRR